MALSLRAIQPIDLDAVHRLERRIQIHDGIPFVTPREEFQEWLDEPHFDLAADSRLVKAEGEVIAWGRIWHRPSEVREARAYLFGGVDPAFRGRGIGSTLITWQMERASELLTTHAPALPRFIRVQAYDFLESAHRLYKRHGLLPIRYGVEMLRDLESIPRVRLIEGIDLVAWDTTLSEQARQAQNDAFADHWGFTPSDRASWEHLLESFGTRLDLSFLAIEGERVVGVCRNGHFPRDEALTGRRDGWIMQVSVVRSHRKRGIASALIAASLAAFKSQNLTHSALAVDTDNPTGAYHLYERLGYRRTHSSVVRQMVVSGDPGAGSRHLAR